MGRSVTAKEQGPGGTRTPETIKRAAPNLPDIFTPLRTFRLAARSIARDESLGGQRFVALVRLVERARAEFGEGSWLAVMVQRIIYAEAKELLLHGRTPTEPSPSWQGDPVTRALWTMHRKGLSNCPTCLRPIPDADSLASMEDRDRAIWAAAWARELAPGPTPA
jgi:hypothetical protein